MDILRNQKGITLMEMSIVAVIFSVVAAMAIPKWMEMMPRMRAKAEIRSVLGALREARSTAIATKIPHGVTFDHTNNRIIVFADTDSPELQTFSPADSILMQRDVEKSVVLCFNTFAGGNVIFASDGSASSSGYLCLSTDDYAHYFNLNVLASTGRVRAKEGYPMN